MCHHNCRNVQNERDKRGQHWTGVPVHRITRRVRTIGGSCSPRSLLISSRFLMRELICTWRFTPQDSDWGASHGYWANWQANERQYSPLQKLLGDWIQAFGGTISGIIWVDKHYLWLVNGCREYQWPIIANVCPSKRSQKSLRRKLVPTPLIASAVGNCEFPLSSFLLVCYFSLRLTSHSCPLVWLKRRKKRVF